MPPKRSNALKRWFLLWVWRVQQPGTIFNLLIGTVNMTLLLNLYIGWRFGDTYVGLLLTMTVVVAILLATSWLWDVKAKMWHEQMEVGVLKNPYQFHKMGPKELVMNKMIWVPLFRQMGMHNEADFLNEWCEEQMELDPILKEQAIEIMAWRNQK